MTRTADALELLRAGGPLEIPQAPTSIEGHYVYVVSNGDDVLQIGHGQGLRLSRVMRGGLAGKHNKAFICAAGEVVLGGQNEYHFVRMPTKEDAEAFERRVHGTLGIRTNAECATWIRGFSGTGYVEIQEQLWERLKLGPEYCGLNEVERSMAEDLFELVTYPRHRIQRQYPIRVPASQGDNLEGHILQSLGASYLIVVFEKLTRGYLRYRSHRPDDETYRRMLEEYVPTRAAPREGRRPAEPRTSPPDRIGPHQRQALYVGPASQPVAPVSPANVERPIVRRLSESVLNNETHEVNAGGDGRAIYVHRIDPRFLKQRVVLKLSWRLPTEGSARHAGYFELDLRRLLEGRYVAREDDGKIRLTFHLRDRDEIWLYVNLQSPMLRLTKLGANDLALTATPEDENRMIPGVRLRKNPVCPSRANIDEDKVGLHLDDGDEMLRAMEALLAATTDREARALVRAEIRTRKLVLARYREDEALRAMETLHRVTTDPEALALIRGEIEKRKRELERYCGDEMLQTLEALLKLTIHPESRAQVQAAIGKRKLELDRHCGDDRLHAMEALLANTFDQAARVEIQREIEKRKGELDSR